MRVATRVSLLLVWPVLIGIGAALIAVYEPWLLSHTLLHDDSFYYLKIASNWAATGSMSFSGYGETTGFHPMWAYTLGGVFRLLSLPGQNPIVGPIVAMFALSTLNASVFVVANERALYKLTGDRWRSGMTTLIFFGFAWRFLYDGMESGLVLALLAVSFLAAMNQRFGVLGLLLSCMPWVRMDAAIFALVFALLAFAGLFKRRARGAERQRGLRMWVVPLALVLAPLVVSAALRSAIMESQVSESVKFYWFSLKMIGLSESFSGPTHYLANTVSSTIRHLANIFDPLTMAYAPTRVFNSNPDGSHAIQRAILALVFMGGLASVLLRLRAGSLEQLRGDYLLSSAVAAICSCSYLLIVRFFAFWGAGWQWYMAAPVYGLLIAGILLWYGLHDDEARQPVRPLARGIALAVLAVLVIGNIRFVQGILDPRPKEWRSLYNTMVLAMDALPLEPDESIGTWAAGHIGYFSRHRVVNLEGLIESPEVLQASFADDIRPLLSSHGIRYIAIKATTDDLRVAVGKARSGVPKWRMSQRKRVFKDLEWAPVVDINDPQLRSPFSIQRVAPR